MLKYPDPLSYYPETIERVQVKRHDGISFEETPKFLTDLVDIGGKYPWRDQIPELKKLSELIKFEINSKLPAVVYISILFIKGSKLFNKRKSSIFNMGQTIS